MRTKLDPMKPAAPVTSRVRMGVRCPGSVVSAGFVEDALEVLAVVALAGLVDQALELRGVDELLDERDLLNAGDLEALPLFERLDELGAGEEAGVRAGVEPGDAAAHGLDAEVALDEVGAVD